MTSEEIRKRQWNTGDSNQVAIEICAQLAEANEIKREELARRETGQINERLSTRNRKMAQALLSTNKRIRADLDNHNAAGHESHAVKLLQEQLTRNEALLDEK